MQGMYGPCPDRAMMKKRTRFRQPSRPFPVRNMWNPDRLDPKLSNRNASFRRRLGMAVERANKTHPYQPAERPSARVQNHELMLAGEADAAQLSG